MTSKAQITKFIKVLQLQMPDLEIKRDETFKKHTTIGVGGRIFAYVSVSSDSNLISLVRLCKKNNINYFILGNGSNILASDKTFYDLVIKVSTSKLYRNKNSIIASSGVNMFALNQFAISEGLSGLEWSFGIPGSVGGGVKMNAGSFGHEFSEFIESVYYTDGTKIYKKRQKDLNFGYRESFFSNNNYVVLSVKFVLKEGKSNEIKQKCLENFEKRLKNQPYGERSAGSVFKRPENNFAPVLIERCGLKGLKIGDAQVSTKHCGFIINLGNAKSSEIFKIICKIKKTVLKKFDIMLQEEVVVIN